MNAKQARAMIKDGYEVMLRLEISYGEIRMIKLGQRKALSLMKGLRGDDLVEFEYAEKTNKLICGNLSGLLGIYGYLPEKYEELL